MLTDEDLLAHFRCNEIYERYNELWIVRGSFALILMPQFEFIFTLIKCNINSALGNYLHT